MLFISAIIAGIAALTAVRSFSVNLSGDIDREAKSLLGADLVIEGNAPMPDSIRSRILAVNGVSEARVMNLLSMVYFPKNGGTRLSMIRALEGDYPFFGAWKTSPTDAWKTFRGGDKVLLEHALMLQFDVAEGDSVQIGKRHFVVEGDLLSRPGRAGIGAAISPVAFIPMRLLDSTALVQKGSRVWYQYFYKILNENDLNALIKTLEKPIDKANLDLETVETNKKSLGQAFGSFSTFLNLVGFIALLLGCIGVAGAVHLYIRDKLPTVAVLRCLGASGKKALYVYLVQVAGIGLLGALLGATLGSLIQKVLPWLVKDLLPIATVSTDFSPVSFIQGVLLGLVVSVLFALLPLLGILKASPLMTLRAGVEESAAINRWLQIGVYVFIGLAVFAFSWWLIGRMRDTLFFIGGVALAFGILYLTAMLLMQLLKRFFPKNWSYIWRQGLANLFRPNNQTVLLVVTIGLGAMLLSTLFLVQTMLLRQVAFSGSGRQPNMVLFDIQTNEKDSVAAMVRRRGMPLMQEVPVVTMRLETLDGRDKSVDQADSTRSLSRWVWDREYRVTFRDTLIDTEKIIEGAWLGRHTPGQPIQISISDGLQKAMKISLGAKLVFNVQGTRIETVVGSIRRVDFSRIQTNFLIVFPEGVLEKAPQFHVVVSRVEDAAQSAAFQSELVRTFPGISAIDLTQILKSVDEILGKISFVIRFMALFSILTGLLVLISSLYQSKYARIRESVLLRTLGAGRRQILWINTVEYFLLGALAGMAGIGLSIAGAWALARFAFEISFFMDWLPVLATFFAITGLTVLIGLLNSRDVLNKAPLEVLRNEV